MPLEVLTDAQSASSIGAKTPVHQGAISYCLCCVGPGKRWRAGHLSENRAAGKIPPHSSSKGDSPNGQQRLHKGFCSSEQFAVLSAWKTHCLSVFNYGETNFNFHSRFNLTFPPPWHGWKMAKSSWKGAAEVGRWGGGGRGIRSSGWSWDSRLGITHHMVVESGRKWTQFSLFRALTCYESKY